MLHDSSAKSKEKNQLAFMLARTSWNDCALHRTAIAAPGRATIVRGESDSDLHGQPELRRELLRLLVVVHGHLPAQVSHAAHQDEAVHVGLRAGERDVYDAVGHDADKRELQPCAADLTVQHRPDDRLRAPRLAERVVDALGDDADLLSDEPLQTLVVHTGEAVHTDHDHGGDLREDVHVLLRSFRVKGAGFADVQPALA